LQGLWLSFSTSLPQGHGHLTCIWVSSSVSACPSGKILKLFLVSLKLSTYTHLNVARTNAVFKVHVFGHEVDINVIFGLLQLL